ncbi:MAG: hypothetical protein ABI340_08710 [Nitrososphaera sp.]|jgi:hypothetical protein
MNKEKTENVSKYDYDSKTRISKKNKMQIAAIAGIGMLLFAISGFGSAWAETGATCPNGAKIKASSNLINDPASVRILCNIELFKQNYAATQQRQQIIDQQQQFIEQQRKIANEYLQADLASMHNSNNLSTPQNAYAGFVSQVDNSTKSLFWDEFSYTQNKVMQAKLAMSAVLQNGGSIQEALQSYYNAAATHKSDLVSENAKLNIAHNFADGKVQNQFNSLGTVQRT